MYNLHERHHVASWHPHTICLKDYMLLDGIHVKFALRATRCWMVSMYILLAGFHDARWYPCKVCLKGYMLLRVTVCLKGYTLLEDIHVLFA